MITRHSLWNTLLPITGLIVGLSFLNIGIVPLIGFSILGGWAIGTIGFMLDCIIRTRALMEVWDGLFKKIIRGEDEKPHSQSDQRH